MSESSESVNEADTNGTECSECGESHEDGACWDEPESKQLTAEDLAGIRRAERSETKKRTFEYPDGTASFEIQMLTEGKKQEIGQQYGEQDFQGNRGSLKVKLPEEDYNNLRAHMIREGVVEGPPGYKGTRDHIKQTYPEAVLEDLFDAITDFSGISEEERITFP